LEKNYRRRLRRGFRQRDLKPVEALCRRLGTVPSFAWRALLKGADKAFLQGDPAAEKRARESTGGRLRLEEQEEQEEQEGGVFFERPLPASV
jgi:hypothetical protein